MIYKEVLLREMESYSILFDELSEEELTAMESAINHIASLPRTSVRGDAIREFNKTFGIKIDLIMAFGETSIFPTKSLKDIIPWDKQTGYNCYVKEKITTTVKLHETAEGSWTCFINKIHNPKYGIIYKKLK